MSAAPREFDHYTFVLLGRPSDAPDPSVRAGRMRPDVFTWMTAKGALQFPPTLDGSGSS